MIEPMSVDLEKTVRENLDNTVHMSLGTSKDNTPWVCEVHFAYDKDLNLYWRSKPSRRHSQDIAANPNVAGNIVRQHALGEYPLGVYFEGTAELLGSDEQQVAYECLSQRLGLGEKILEDAAQEDGHKFYKVTVKNWYVFGKLEEEKGGQKYQLNWNGNKK